MPHPLGLNEMLVIYRGGAEAEGIGERWVPSQKTIETHFWAVGKTVEIFRKNRNLKQQNVLNCAV
jgi:hypothetical protein